MEQEAGYILLSSLAASLPAEQLLKGVGEAEGLLRLLEPALGQEAATELDRRYCSNVVSGSCGMPRGSVSICSCGSVLHRLCCVGIVSCCPRLPIQLTVPSASSAPTLPAVLPRPCGCHGAVVAHSRPAGPLGHCGGPAGRSAPGRSAAAASACSGTAEAYAGCADCARCAAGEGMWGGGRVSSQFNACCCGTLLARWQGALPPAAHP